MRTAVLVAAMMLLPVAAQGQTERWLDPKQPLHWSIKAGASAATYFTLTELEVNENVATAVAMLAPTVIGKLVYAPKGLGGKRGEKWPSVGFVARDIAGELCVQSAPAWYRLFKGSKLWHKAAAIGGYAASLILCARQLEVR